MNKRRRYIAKRRRAARGFVSIAEILAITPREPFDAIAFGGVSESITINYTPESLLPLKAYPLEVGDNVVVDMLDAKYQAETVSYVDTETERVFTMRFLGKNE